MKQSQKRDSIKIFIKIHFAHRTFKWGNEAKANAAVHVVIIGFSNYDISEKFIYEYEDIKAEPHELKVKNINPYLVEGKDNFITEKSNPICNVPSICRGSDATDDGNLLLNLSEKEELLQKHPDIEDWIRPFGIITSTMHMTWVKYVCGRMKSDYRYSNSVVYNNYPWPETPSDKIHRRFVCGGEKEETVGKGKIGFIIRHRNEVYNQNMVKNKLW